MMTQDTHIKIYDTAPWTQHTADGKQTEFAYPFPIFRDSDIQVFIGQTRQFNGFTITGAGHSSGGTVIFPKAPDAGHLVTLRRDIPIERTRDFQANVINDDLDRVTAQIQQVGLEARRGLKLSPTDPSKSLTLPLRDQRAGKLLGFDDDGTPSTEVRIQDISQADQWARDAQTARVAAETARTAAEAARRDAETAGDQATDASRQAERYQAKVQTARDAIREALQTAQVERATQTEAETGTDNTKIMTPLRTKEAIDEQRPFASQSEATTGTDNTKLMTPLRVKEAMQNQQPPATIPVGTIIAFAATKRPSGYLNCNGAYISRYSYSRLYNVVGSRFGSSGIRFRLPDFRGTFLRGWDDGRGYDLTRSFGSFQGDDFKSHTHDFSNARTARTHDAAGFITSGHQGTTIQSITGTVLNHTGGPETRPKNYAINFYIKY